MRKIAIVGGVVMISAVAGALGVTNSVEAANTRYTTTFKLVDKTTGKTLRTIKISGVKNLTYTFQPNKIQYYATPKAVKYTVRRTGTIKVNYVATYRKVTIKSIDAFDHRVIQNNTKMVKVGTTPLIAPVAAAKGYSLKVATTPVRLTKVNKDTSVNFNYDKMVPVTVKYNTVEGTGATSHEVLLGTVTKNYRRGYMTTFNAKQINGYVLPKQQTTAFSGSATVKFNYVINRSDAYVAYNQARSRVRNKERFDQAMRAYKMNIDNATSLREFNAAKAAVSNLGLVEFRSPLAVYDKHVNLNRWVTDSNLNYNPLAQAGGRGVFAKGTADNYLAYFQADTDSGNFYWVINQRTKVGGWVNKGVFANGGVGVMKDISAYTESQSNYSYTDKISKAINQPYMDEDGFQAVLQSVELNHNAAATGLDNNDDIVTGDGITLVRLHFMINGYVDSQGSEIDNLLQYPEIELADGDTLQSVNSLVDTTYTKGSWDAFFVTTNAQADKILQQGATLHYGTTYQGRVQYDQTMDFLKNSENNSNSDEW